MSEDEIIKYIKNEIEIDIDTRDSFKNNKESPVYKDLDECIKAHQSLLDLYQQEKEKYKRLSIEAQATAFMDCNKDTETLMRVLLKQGQIKLENGMYKRQDFDWEKNLMMLGLMKKREKTFYLPDEENIDEYTKQLENQLQEYNKLKEIFSKRNIKNETMYDGFCRLEEKLEEEKEKIEAMNKGIDELVREKQDLKTELYMNSVSKDKIRGIFNNKIMKEKENLEQILMEENINKAFTTNAIESKISEFKKLEKQLLEEE